MKENLHVSSGSEVFIGISGGSASGKTTICREITEYFGDEIQIISQDSYYRDRSHLTENEIKEINFDHPSSLNLDQIYHDIVTLKEKKEVWIPQYCFKTHSILRAKTKVQLKKINVIEGLYALESEKLRSLFDLSIYIHADDDIRLVRRIKRDMAERGRDLESVLNQYLLSVKPMYDQYIIKQKKYAQYVLDTTSISGRSTGASSLVDKIKSLII